jgi:subtilisin family serine protease
MRRAPFFVILVLGLAAVAQRQQTPRDAPHSDPRMSPALRRALDDAGPFDILTIVVRIRPDRPRSLDTGAWARGNAAGRRSLVVQSLRDHARVTQESTIAVLEQLKSRGLVSRIHPLWIANVVVVEARPGAVEMLRGLPWIDVLAPDFRQRVVQQADPDVSWNVAALRANTAWGSGLTGAGVTVALVDDGVSLKHPDLEHRIWMNPGETKTPGHARNGKDDDGNGYVDDTVGFDFVAVPPDNDPEPFGVHGTQVAGLIVGDGSGGTITGVAPGARLMILKIVADDQASESDAWEAMEYALLNGADIINMSLRWVSNPAQDPSVNDDIWRETVDNLADAGVLFVAAAGNRFAGLPDPLAIQTPARSPRSLTVGAVDAAGNRWDGSCRGPVTWEEVPGFRDYPLPHGLLKPDVMAPGVNVTTTSGTGYASDPIGTSMAAPQVAGIAALLLQKHPGLAPHELAFLIRETAGQGSTPPDRLYGYGPVDAVNAIQHPYTGAPAHDVAISPTSGLWTTDDIWVDNDDDGNPDDPVAGRSNNLYARIHNLGGRAVGQAEIKFYYADVGTVGTSGFDPDRDGDPDDGIFIPIGSYFVPVLGPAGSSQETMTGMVRWQVPPPITDHWCVGVGVVARTPPNAPEANRGNNTAFRNFFNIELPSGAIEVFEFTLYPDPQRPRQPFDLEIDRRGVPLQYRIALAVEAPRPRWWPDRAEGLRIAAGMALPADPDRPQWEVHLLESGRAVLRGIALPDGAPVRLRLVLQAPRRTAGPHAQGPPLPAQPLVVNARNRNGIFGGLTLSIVPPRR